MEPEQIKPTGRQNFKIEIETTGNYETKKEFNIQVELSDRQYLALVGAVLDFLDNEKQADE